MNVITVLGAGEMGHGLAELAAMYGYDVWMYDIEQKFLDRGMERIRWSLGKLVENQQLGKDESEEALGRIRTTTDLKEAVGTADLVIEAIPEDLELKKKVFAQVDAMAPPKAVLASNTSGLSITAMAAATKRPGKVVGMHFFNPAILMPLVEIVRGRNSSDDAIALARAVASSLAKVVIVCRKDVPGFITSRTIAPYMYEAAWIHHEEGVPTEVIDSAMRFQVGFPMGPFELADQVGLDVLYHAGKGQDIPVPPPIEALVKQGQFGKKTGRGFYDYKGEKPAITPDQGKDFDVLRILAPVVNEAARLVEWGVAWPREIDAAMRLGTAFPKGPLKLADEYGLDTIVEALEKAKRYDPVPILVYKVAIGELGTKAGIGFYQYGKEEKPLEFETILVEKNADGYATLTLNRPDRLNTINPQLIEEMDRALDALGRDEEVRALVIRGAGGRAFSAGADLTAFSDIDKSYKVWRNSRRWHEVFRRLERFPKPTVAAIDGYCFGGGCEMAISCDFRIASRKSKMGQTEITLGLIPGAGGTLRITRLLGLAKAKELVLLGSRLTAEEAERIGLITKVVDDAAFEEEVAAFAKKLAAGPPIAMRLAKALLTEGAETPLDAAMEMEALAFGTVTGTEDIFEGLDAFMNKRPPKFKGQ